MFAKYKLLLVLSISRNKFSPLFFSIPFNLNRKISNYTIIIFQKIKKLYIFLLGNILWFPRIVLDLFQTRPIELQHPSSRHSAATPSKCFKHTHKLRPANTRLFSRVIILFDHEDRDAKMDKRNVSTNRSVVQKFPQRFPRLFFLV